MSQVVPLRKLDPDARVTQLEPWLSKESLARYYDCSERWVEERIYEGMPSCIIAGKRKFRLSQIEPWLRERGYIGGEQ